MPDTTGTDGMEKAEGTSVNDVQVDVDVEGKGSEEVEVKKTNSQVAEDVEYVLGVDFGTSSAVVTLTSTKSVKPDILRNDLSNQSTPICVSFNTSPKQRSFGSLALQNETSNKGNVIRGILPAIGKTQEEFSSGCPWDTSNAKQGEDQGSVEFELDYQLDSEKLTLKPEQVYASFLAKLASFAETSLARTVEEEEGKSKEELVRRKFAVSIVVPDLFEEKQLAAVKRAVSIAQVNCVRLITRGAAVCFAYGTRKTEEILDGSVTMFVDVGHKYVTVAIYKWDKKSAQHVVTKCSETLGSYRLDKAIFDLLSKDCEAKYGGQVKAGSKGGIRLLKLCKKLKESLSAVPEAEGTCENLFDQDIRFSIKRERVVEACSDIKEELRTLLTEAVEACPEPITVCELIGGGMRVPFVKEVVSEVIGKDLQLSYTLDSMAAPGTGASYAGVRLFEPTGGIRRPAFDNLCKIVDDHGLYDPSNIDSMVDDSVIESMKSMEASMKNIDLEVVEISAARNKLESFIFETRSAAGGNKEFSNLIDKESCLRILTEYEDWLYTEEADNANVETYTKKIEQLKVDLGPSCNEYLQKVEEERLKKEKELEEISKKAAEELEASGGKDDHDFRKLSKPDRMKKVVMNKEEGTSLFKDGNYEAASLRYKRSLQHCDKFFDLSKEDETEVETIKHSLHLNIAMCHIKLEAWDFGLKACNEALEINKDSTKALYRRAVILEKTKDFDKAKVDLTKALKHEPEDKSLNRLLERVNIHIKRQKLKQKKMAQKMFG